MDVWGGTPGGGECSMEVAPTTSWLLPCGTCIDLVDYTPGPKGSVKLLDTRQSPWQHARIPNAMLCKGSSEQMLVD